MEGGEGLVWRCIEAAAKSAKSVEKWRRQRRTLERLPSQLADALFRLLLRRRLLYPSLLEVFQYCVEEVDFHGESYVDAEWMAYLGAFRYLRVLNLSGCRGISNSVLWSITGMATLKELDLSRCLRITDAGLEHILSIQNLEKLNISETRVTSKGIKRLSSLVNLRSLDLGGLPCTDLAINSLTVLIQLEYLDLWGSEITNEGSLLFAMFPRLTHLSVAWTKVNMLPDLPSLIHLNMSNCNIHSILLGHHVLSELLVHGAAFANMDQAFSQMDTSRLLLLDLSSAAISNLNFLDRMQSLERLDLSSCPVTDDLFIPLTSAVFNLRDLNLSNTKITSQALCILVGNLPNLENFSLSESLIDDTSLQYLAAIHSLRTLDLSKTSIQGFIFGEGYQKGKILSLSLLQSLENLETLKLEDTRLRDEALCPLGFLSGLRSLYLKSDFLSDVSLHATSALSSLRTLGFQGAVLSDSGLLSFRPPKKLEALDLRGCWLLTKDALSSFCGSFPQIEVKHEFMQLLRVEQSQTSGPFKLKPEWGKFEISYRIKVKDERIKYSREELMELTSSPSEVLIRALSLLPLALRKARHLEEDLLTSS